MAETVKEWQDRVDRASKHAADVYNDEVKRLQDQIEATDKREGREVKHVEHEVELDAKFAAHHVEYLAKVIDREVERVDRANALVAKRQEEGKSDKSVQHAADHAARVEADAEKHVADVACRVEREIERDARAAARHVVAGANKLDLDDDRLAERADHDADEVAKAADRVVDKVED